MLKMALSGLAVAVIALLAVTVEAALDRKWPDRNDGIFIAAIAGGLAVIGVAVFVHFGRFS